MSILMPYSPVCFIVLLPLPLHPPFLSLPASRPDMKCGERVCLIEERIRRIQQKWSDLKSEVAHLDRRRRRVRRIEREGLTFSITFLIWPRLKCPE